MIGYIGTSVTISLNYNWYNAIADLHNLQFTVAHALRFSVSTSCLLATDLNTETFTSNHPEVFMSFLVQSPWSLGTRLKVCHSSSLRLPAKDLSVVPYEPSARTYRKHVTWSISTVVWRHRLRGSVFTETLPRNGLHNFVVLLLRACIASDYRAVAWKCIDMSQYFTDYGKLSCITTNSTLHRAEKYWRDIYFFFTTTLPAHSGPWSARRKAAT
jgi:hypothetical protein